MFGESESESPRVPSPWDSLMSTSPSPAPGQALVHTPSPLATELIPRLVPEADDGNVEYKLQLLNPSPARFARLVTQLKWRLLEGGGQAYYELGVADSGDLIGLPREHLEQSLETLEMMAGEIGASVVVVKEIEVPAAMVELGKHSGEWANSAGKVRKENGPEGGYSTAAETETDPESLSGTDVDLSGGEIEDLSITVILEKIISNTQQVDDSSSSATIFPMDELDQDPTENADDESLSVRSQSRFCLDLEISSVFKPRPVRSRMHPHNSHLVGGKSKRAKKHKHLSMLDSSNGHADHHRQDANDKAHDRRSGRDRRRDEKRRALENLAAQAISLDDDVSSSGTTVDRQETLKAVSISNETEALITGLGALHVQHVEEPASILNVALVADPIALTMEDELQFADDDDDVFSSPNTAVPSFPTFSKSSTGESHLDAAVIGIAMSGVQPVEEGQQHQTRLIVEALVVRKMSIEEAFLDFGGFSLT